MTDNGAVAAAKTFHDLMEGAGLRGDAEKHGLYLGLQQMALALIELRQRLCELEERTSVK